MTVGPGTTLGPYEILSLLGEGGMGSVWKARDPRLGRYVAIKVAKEKFNERFDREARAVAALNHNNICTLYDIGPNYLVMEYIEGPTLTARIKEGAMSVDAAMPILQQLVDGIEAAHEKNIYHRDLKPDNIKITPEGVVKILDFGLAKAADPLAMRDDPANAPTIRIATVAGVIMGTPAYMSPEQATGKPVDKRSDVWAFGVILWEMLTAGPLFGGATIVETLADVVRQEIDYAQLPSGTPEPIQKILRGCLVRDARMRIRDIGDVRIALEKYAAGEQEITAAPVAQRKRPWLYPALAALFALAAAGLGVLYWLASRPVPRQFVKLGAELGASLPSTFSSSTSLAVSPDGSRVVFLARNKEGNFLFSRRLDQDLATQMPGTEGAFYPFFSPDGRWVGFFTADSLKKVSVDGGAPITLCASAGSSGRGASWGDDGNIVATLANNAALSLIPASGGKPTALTELSAGEHTHRFPSVLPGARGVLFISSKSNNDYSSASVEVYSLKDRKRKVLATGVYPRYLASGHLTYIHSNTLFAVPFDIDRMEAKGLAFPVLEGIASSLIRGNAIYDVSRNGTLVYYRGARVEQEGTSLEWVDATGRGTPIPGLNAVTRPRLSADGKRLAYLQREGTRVSIWVYDLQRNAKVKLTFEEDASGFAWNAGSQAILFSSGFKLYWTRADGASKPQQIFEDSGSLFLHDVSPDGKLLALGRTSANMIALAHLEYAGANSTETAPRMGKLDKCCEERNVAVLAGRFSPDGKWIAYGTADGTNNQVYVRAVPDSGAKWQVSAADGGQAPVWSPNGREIFYYVRLGRIMAVDYTAKGSTFTPGTPRHWADREIPGRSGHTNMTIAPDGKRMVVVSAPGGQPTEATTQAFIIFNLFEEVRRRALANGQ
ncbi:MAG: serine/threonine-protein kinase [Candidatus Solibacter usitatus]|nr:serine/threonine-protein kinase [Candidatus Solibacter usitatus]